MSDTVQVWDSCLQPFVSLPLIGGAKYRRHHGVTCCANNGLNNEDCGSPPQIGGEDEHDVCGKPNQSSFASLLCYPSSSVCFPVWVFYPLEVTGYESTGLDFNQFWLLGFALRTEFLTARLEAASWRKVDGSWGFSRQHYPMPLMRGVWYRDV